MNNFSPLILTLLILSCCKENDPPPCSGTINKKITPLAIEDYYGLVNIPCAVWLKNNFIYNPHPFQYRQVNENFEVINNSIINMFQGGYYIETNLNNNKILYVQTRFKDISEGALREYDIVTGQFTELFDSTENISSAVYYHGSDDSIIYYTYGKPFYNNHGYFLYNRITSERKLILPYLAQHYLPEAELVNGFDLHPTENKLLIPAVRNGMPPLVMEYNMDTRELDTLDITFDFSFNRICLWLRFSNSGDKVLYSCYPAHSGTSTTNDDSEIGVIDMGTLGKRILDVNTNPCGRSVNVFPNWSPDDRHIVYGSGKLVMPEGARGSFHLYILKDVY